MTDRVGQQLGHYRLIRVLSDRFFSRLYLGHHLQDNHPALIRVLDLSPPRADEEAHFLTELQRQVAHHSLNPDEVWVGNHHQLLLSEPLTDLERSFHSSDKLNDYVLPNEVLEREFSYLAPERIEDQPGSCAASDQYALAIMIYEWLCGELLYKGNWPEIALQQLRASPTPLCQKVSTIPPEVEEVVLRALEKDPQKRFASVQAFVTALGQAASPQRLK